MLQRFASCQVISRRLIGRLEMDALRVLRLAELGGSVNAVDGIYWTCDEIQGTIVAAAGENKLCVWMRNSALNSEFSLLYQHCTGSVLVLDCKLHWLPKCHAPVLACACDDGNVHLFTSQLVDRRLSFVKSIVITGHEDWVRTLSFTTEGIHFVVNAVGQY